MSEMIITRFAPSPTGVLHIGSARTALFNWIYAKHCKGKYLLRIEDTDKERSTESSKKQLIESLRWLGIDWDDEVVIQSERIARHQEVVSELIRRGKAYYCYMTPEEIDEQRKNDPFARLQSPWRDSTITPAAGAMPVVRMKFPFKGTTSFYDAVQGEISCNNSELSDIIILRSDGTPTYLLAVVVDDHDMGVNYVIRGDDHITNTFKQILIYEAMGWGLPKHAHIPLIHGADGAKLSKRHAALGVEHYREAGYLPEAICNYLLRLGWGGDGKQECLTKEEAIAIFDVEDLSKSPSKFDQDKLDFLNAYYMNKCHEDHLFELALNFWQGDKSNDFLAKARKAITLFKQRCKTVVEIANMFNLLVAKSELDGKSREVLADHKDLIKKLKSLLTEIDTWQSESIKLKFHDFALRNNMKDSIIMQCLRAAIIGTFASPGIYDMMEILGKYDCVKRIDE